MPISTKLTLLVLVLPVSVIISVFAVGFYLYRSSFDASAFSTAVSSLLSALLVILLVWERLRESLFKKLRYLHRNFLFKLHNIFHEFGSLFWTQDETRKLKIDLERYGKFMVFSLYPNGLLGKIDEFLSLRGEFYKRFQEIEEMAMNQFQNLKTTYDRWDFLLQLGIAGSYQRTLSTEIKERYTTVERTISEQHPQLTSECKVYFEKTNKLRENILNELEDFFKRNNLRLEEEVRFGRGY